MLRSRATRWLSGCAIAVGLCAGLRGPSAAQGVKFDKLNDADRQDLGERFKKEVWPFLVRGGKDGCVGCHSGKGIVSALRFSGDADKDFRMLVREGFFLLDDGGSLLGRIEDTNKKRVMPPPKNGSPWTEMEKKILSDLAQAIDRKQKK
jgi:hypothetical protein